MNYILEEKVADRYDDFCEVLMYNDVYNGAMVASINNDRYRLIDVIKWCQELFGDRFKSEILHCIYNPDDKEYYVTSIAEKLIANEILAHQPRSIRTPTRNCILAFKSEKDYLVFRLKWNI